MGGFYSFCFDFKYEVVTSFSESHLRGLIDEAILFFRSSACVTKLKRNSVGVAKLVNPKF